MEQVKEEKRR